MTTQTKTKVQIVFKTEQDAIANDVEPKFFQTLGYKTNLMDVNDRVNTIKREHLAQLKDLILNIPQGQGFSPSLTTVRGSGGFRTFNTSVCDREWTWRMEKHYQDGREYFVNYSSWDNGNGNDCEGIYWIEDSILYYAPCVQEWNSYIRRHQGKVANGFGIPVAVC